MYAPRLLPLLRSRAAPFGDQLISGSARLSEPRITALRGSPHSAEDTCLWAHEQDVIVCHRGTKLSF
jgi:hypothetical protein